MWPQGYANRHSNAITIKNPINLSLNFVNKAANCSTKQPHTAQPLSETASYAACAQFVAIIVDYIISAQNAKITYSTKRKYRNNNNNNKIWLA